MSAIVISIINNISTIGWIVVGGSLLALVMTGIVYLQDITRRSGLAFLFLGVIVFLWGLSYAFFDGAFRGAYAEVGIMVLYSAAATVPVFLFLFFYTFSTEKKKNSVWNLFALFVPFLLILTILVGAPDFIVGHQLHTGEEKNVIVFGKGFWLYALYIVAFLVACGVLLVNKYRTSAGIYKVAIRGLIISLALTCLTALAMSLFSPFLIWGSDLFWGGHIAVILFIFAIAFILAKYNFWNIKIILTEFFTSIIIITMIVEIFFASSTIDLIVKTGITVLIIFSCAFLDGSIKREIQSKDKITRLLFEIDFLTEQLKVLDKKKSEFLSIASHHLRDPLTTIKGYASMLMEGSLGELPENVKDAIGKIFDSSERLLLMVSDFMDVARIESGDMNYQFADVDMKKLVLELSEEMKQSADRAHLALSVIIDEGIIQDISFVIVGDEGKLRQVASNLIDNAVKYTPKGEVSILLSKSPDNKKVLFSISDTGIGMSDTTKDKIFKKFSRAEGVSKVYTEGTGLGLYVAGEVIKKHGGRIWAESKGEGQGSTFFVELQAKG
ncbi:MAG: ATP-binding protein [Candidatus Paceibacterota bacterium]|jgi:signal transduction histidine kinase